MKIGMLSYSFFAELGSVSETHMSDRGRVLSVQTRRPHVHPPRCPGQSVSRLLPPSRTFSDVGGYDDLVVISDIGFFSHCEHRMLPFNGKVHIGDVPSENVLGFRNSPASLRSSRVALKRRRR